jgi:hypothetical protein
MTIALRLRRLQLLSGRDAAGGCGGAEFAGRSAVATLGEATWM